ncbi:MAG: hypothetical protein PHN68_04015 [Prolixibacteraceae bacterium]|jgi:hypothetical protein|nr:hypothetical protein [Prolixibacteraceae bacterium]MDD4754732.1 hypothetical protein [Prolixibacteraceae bacterium]
MKPKYNTKNSLINKWRMIRYNMKIIFSGRFIWFLLAAFAFFLIFAIQMVWNNVIFSEVVVYSLLIFPGILLIFYPTVFGIQSDDDSRMLEILFGIPNYRYKVWLVRLLLIYILVFLMIVLFSFVASVLLYRVDVLEMAYQLMYPVIFMGSLSFMFSTVIKNGNGTAVIVILIGVALLMIQNNIARTQWNVFLNPFQLPTNYNEIIWQGIVTKNRIFLGVGSVIFILYGLYNLQKREKFV